MKRLGIMLLLASVLAAEISFSSPLEAKETRALRFAVSAMISPQETFSLYVDIKNYLSRQLNRDIILKQRRTYQEVNRLLRNGQIDFAWLCTGGFLEARADFGAIPLATPRIQGAPHYYAFVIVPRDSTVDSFEELRGKRFAFTDPLSHTGRIFPTYLVTSEGERVESFFARTFYTHSHDRAIEVVAQGLADGASVDSLVYEFLLALKPDLVSQTRIIQVSQPFGAPPIVAGPNLSPEWRQRIQNALFGMKRDPEGKSILSRLRVDDYVTPSQSFYNEAERVWRVVVWNHHARR